MASIRERGPNQFFVEIRRKGVVVPRRTFETRKEAKDWADVIEGKVVGNEYVGPSLANSTTFLEALEWYETDVLPKIGADRKNQKIKLNFWKKSEFKHWKLSALHSWDLIAWRKETQDEAHADPKNNIYHGEDAKWAPQTCWHYLQLISKLYNSWSQEHKTVLTNPVSDNVRPVLNNCRERRLFDELDNDGNDEEARMFAAVRTSRSRWLESAVIISLETGVRQTELAGLTWDRVRLDVEYPNFYIPKNLAKNENARTVPLSTRAVAAFKVLKDPSMPYSVGEVKAMNLGKSLNTVLGVNTGRAIMHAFNAVIDDEHFPDLNWHDLRHEAISRLFERTDFRDQEVMAIVGHLSEESLKRYTHLRAAKLGKRMG
jgi:integrase